MAVIEGGASGRKAEVNEENELVVRAVVETELEHASARLGQAYSWVSADSDINTGDTRIFLKNNGDTSLVLDQAIFLPANVECDWSIHLGKDATTPTGTVVTGVNLSQAGNVADATAFDDETAVADGDIISYVHTLTIGTHHHTLNGVILQKGHYIQITQITESTSGRVIIIGHFENPS